MNRSCAQERAALLLAGLAACFMGSWWMRGVCPFWGDLSYLSQPWRAFNAELLEAGRLPLWDPYAYLGMPHAAQMQNGLFYPGSLFFCFFGWANALRLYDLLHFWLAGFLAYLWLRSIGLGNVAALGGGAAYGFGGWIWIRVEWPNQLGVLALLPALLLFSRSPRSWGAAWALAFFAGYPLFAIGGAAAAMATLFVLRGTRLLKSGECRRMPAAGLWAAGLAAVLLLPAWELLRHSTRAQGLDWSSVLSFGFKPADFWGWISPFLVPGPRPPLFHLRWWSCDYLGLVGAGVALRGLAKIERGVALRVFLWLFIIGILLLGRSTGLSLWLWTRLAPLRYLRYPGNLAYLAWPCLAFLVAAGFPGGRRAGGALLLSAMLVELLAYSRFAFPTEPDRVLTAAGPLASYLQTRLAAGERYLLSPRAQAMTRGRGLLDWKSRLYGLSNLPYKIRSADNVGEPLEIASSSDFLDFLSSRPSAAAAAAYFPWAAVRLLLAPSPVSAPLAREARIAWEIGRLKAPMGRVAWFDEKSGSSISPGLPPPSFSGRPLPTHDVSETLWTADLSREAPGWLFISEPRYPGWTFTLAGPGHAAPVALETEPAAEAFQKCRVPPGFWRLYARYDPWSLRLGLAGTLFALFLLYWRGRRSLAEASARRA